jgi:hypothetical protein
MRYFFQPVEHGSGGFARTARYYHLVIPAPAGIRSEAVEVSLRDSGHTLLPPDSIAHPLE